MKKALKSDAKGYVTSGGNSGNSSNGSKKRRKTNSNKNSTVLKPFLMQMVIII